MDDLVCAWYDHFNTLESASSTLENDFNSFSELETLYAISYEFAGQCYSYVDLSVSPTADGDSNAGDAHPCKATGEMFSFTNMLAAVAPVDVSALDEGSDVVTEDCVLGDDEKSCNHEAQAGDVPASVVYAADATYVHTTHAIELAQELVGENSAIEEPTTEHQYDPIFASDDATVCDAEEEPSFVSEGEHECRERAGGENATGEECAVQAAGTVDESLGNGDSPQATLEASEDISWYLPLRDGLRVRQRVAPHIHNSKRRARRAVTSAKPSRRATSTAPPTTVSESLEVKASRTASESIPQFSAAETELADTAHTPCAAKGKPAYKCRAQSCKCGRTLPSNRARLMHELRAVRFAAKNGIIALSSSELTAKKCALGFRFHSWAIGVPLLPLYDVDAATATA